MTAKQIKESLVARTFGTEVLRGFGLDPDSVFVPILAVGLIVFAYLVNAAGNRSVGLFSSVMAVVKVGGIVVFGAAALWAAGSSFEASGRAAAPAGSWPPSSCLSWP
ncbi:hypothetical protein [Maribius sp. MOLA 401]